LNISEEKEENVQSSKSPYTFEPFENKN